jgi:hypothetical protein
MQENNQTMILSKGQSFVAGVYNSAHSVGLLLFDVPVVRKALESSDGKHLLDNRRVSCNKDDATGFSRCREAMQTSLSGTGIAMACACLSNRITICHHASIA